jgi:SET domain-containing protein
MKLHSWLSPTCEVRPSRLGGFGIFATEAIAAGTVVAVWGGCIYTARELTTLAEGFPQFATHPVQVADDCYLGSTSLWEIDPVERLNHSCSPNVGVQGQVVVLTRRKIEAGEELTFEYETTDISPAPFTCQCGSPECRGRIDGTAWRSPAFQQNHAGWCSWYVTRQILALRGEG